MNNKSKQSIKQKYHASSITSTRIIWNNTTQHNIIISVISYYNSHHSRVIN